MLTDRRRPTPGPVRPPNLLKSLTPREREVLTLLLEGPSNRQLATTLAISERTAEAHVANILAKLELTNRTQVIGWAASNHLLHELASPPPDLTPVGRPLRRARPALTLSAYH